jgi:hypothetical protein
MNIIYTAETKFLGVYITETFKVAHPYVQSLANKLSKVPFMIKSLKKIMSTFVLCNIYFSSSDFTVWNITFFFGGGGGRCGG